MNRIWEIFVRWRTWLVNAALAIMVLLPGLLNSPEVLAVVPAEHQRWVILAAFLVNIWMRQRPAVVKSDPEVDMRKDRLSRGR